ncbi:MAG: hypothetical protein SGBAC_005989 [Bacillariaceae sp.]
MTQRSKQVTAAAGDYLISVTVYKSTANQKAGIKVVQKADGIYITAIAKGGLLDETRVDVGDKLLSINGRRARAGQDTREFMKLISTAGEKVTIVVKKDKGKKKSSNNKSPGRTKKLVQADVFRAKDGSFDFNINPELEEFEKKLSKVNADDYEQFPIVGSKLFEGQGAGLAFKNKEGMLFVSGISFDSIFAETELEFGDRIVSVMDVNFMNYADEKYAKTLIKKAKGEVNIVVEKGWNKLAKAEQDAQHGMPRQESIVIPKKRGKITITKDVPNPKPMESVTEDVVPPQQEEKNVITPEEPTPKRILTPEKEEEESPVNDFALEEAPSTVTIETPEKEDIRTPAKSITIDADESPAKAFTPKSPGPAAMETPEKASPSPRHYTPQSAKKSFIADKASPAIGTKARKFLPPVPKQSKKRTSKTDVDAGDVVSRMLNKLDNERKGIKERHRMRLNQSFDDSVDESQDEPPEKKSPTRHANANRTYPTRKYSSPASSSNGYSTPTKIERTKNKVGKYQQPQGSTCYLCISVRKMSERSPGIKLRSKDSIFILDRLPHDENRIPVGVQVLSINGNDRFDTVVKANELIDSKRQEVELCVSFDGLIAVRPSDDQ